MAKPEKLSRRERQVMDAVYELGEASAKEIQAKIPDPPSYSAVRAVLTRLVVAGELKYRESGLKYVYQAAVPRRKLKQNVLRKTIDTFFEGSPANMMHALLGVSAGELSPEELDEIAEAIEAAREKKS